MSELWQLSRLSTGDRAALKRAAGTLGLNVPALRAFYKADTCREEKWERERYAAMCMACLWNEQETGPVLSMEDCLKRMCWKDNELQNAMARRVEAILKMRWGDDDYLIGKLLNLVRMMKANGEFLPDFQELAKDLKHWNYEGQKVQRRWLRTIYRNGMQNSDNPDQDEEQEEVIADVD